MIKVAKEYHRYSSLNSWGGTNTELQTSLNKINSTSFNPKNKQISITFFIYNKHKVYVLPPDLEQCGLTYTTI
jgi:hypothetical protein